MTGRQPSMSCAERVLRQHAEGWRALTTDMPQHQQAHNFIFDEWLLEHGEACGPLLLKRPKGLRLGQIKQCYQNSFQAVSHGRVDPNEWFYTEGVVLRPDLPIALGHAWLTNRSGEVIDLTLRNPSPDESYFGIPMKPGYVEERTFKHGYYGLFSDGMTYNRDVIDSIEEGRAWPKKDSAAMQEAA